jgi:phage gp46-like protein
MDVLIYHTNDDGDITITNGNVELTNGIDSAAYLCLFGGNLNDPGLSDTSKEWWGNKDEPDIQLHLRSQLQYIINDIPLTVNNLKRFEDAAKADLNTLVEFGAVESVSVTTSIPEPDTLKLSIDLDGTKIEFITEVNIR